MNLFHIHIPYVLIIAILGGILFFQMEFGGHHTVTNNTTSHNYYDSTQHEIKIVKVNGPIQTIEVLVPAIVDTIAILRAYFEKNIYNQIVGDSLMSADISMVISKNKLESLGFKYKILQPTAVIEDHKFKVFAGLTGGANKTGLTSFGPAVSILTNKDHLYGVNYNAINSSVNVDLQWKISLWKKKEISGRRLVDTIDRY